MNKRIKIAFVASLIVNVLLAGVLLGALPQRFDQSSIRQEQMDRAVKELPEPAQTRFREKLGEVRSEVEPMRDQIREARRAAIQILAAEPLDEAAFDRQVNMISELRIRIGDRMAKGVKEVVKDLPPDQRIAVATILDRPPRAR